MEGEGGVQKKKKKRSEMGGGREGMRGEPLLIPHSHCLAQLVSELALEH